MDHGSDQEIDDSIDPEVLQRVVDEFKSQGIFDQIRNDCLSEVDSKVSHVFLR